MRGMYQVAGTDAGPGRPMVQLLGSGALLREALRAADLLAERFGVSSRVWSVTSYTQLRRDAQAATRWNLLHPSEPPRRSYLETILEGQEGPFVATSDNVRAVAEQISPWIPGGLLALGTDGLGRSDLREVLRRHFEVDAEFVVLAALSRLVALGRIDTARYRAAVNELAIDADKLDPLVV
jgi:pyruvate dehydrogenase E1 component